MLCMWVFGAGTHAVDTGVLGSKKSGGKKIKQQHLRVF